MQVDSAPSDDTKPSSWRLKAAVGLLVALLAVGFYSFYGDLLTFDSLVQREAQLRALQQRHPVLVYAVAFLLYVVVTGLSLPGATVMTLVYGWYFGWLRAVVLVSFASTAGATLAFLLSRYLFRDAIQARFGKRLASFNQNLKRDGAFYLFTLRLIPVVPFFVINAVMGLTPLATRTFWWVSQLGMLAGTAVYVYAGASVPSLQKLSDQGVGAAFSTAQLGQITLAFVLIGIFPVLARWAIRLVKGSKPLPSEAN